MTTVRKTISVTRHQDDWIKAQIAQGGYASDSEVIRELIRKAQARTRGGELSEERKAQIVANMQKHDATIQSLAVK